MYSKNRLPTMCILLLLQLLSWPLPSRSQNVGYMAELQSKINQVWRKKVIVKSGPTVSFIILKNGSVKNIKIEKSSGDAVVDGKALQTIKDCSPYRALPQGAPESINMEFTLSRASK